MSIPARNSRFQSLCPLATDQKVGSSNLPGHANGKASEWTYKGDSEAFCFRRSFPVLVSVMQSHAGMGRNVRSMCVNYPAGDV